jgi:hypothetical protein
MALRRSLCVFSVAVVLVPLALLSSLPKLGFEQPTTPAVLGDNGGPQKSSYPSRPSSPYSLVDPAPVLADDLCSGWGVSAVEVPAAHERDVDAPFWLLQTRAPMPAASTTARFAIVVPPISELRVWNRDEEAYIPFLEDVSTRFPPVPLSLPDDILLHVEEWATGVPTSIRPVLCGSLRQAPGSHLYAAAVSLARAGGTQLLTSSRQPAGEPGPPVPFTLSGLVLLRNWTWNCACPHTPEYFALAEERRATLPPVELLLTPAAGGTQASEEALGAVPCGSPHTALKWRRETSGLGGCGLGCDGMGYAFGEPACSPLQAPAIQELFTRLGYSSGALMLGDSNMRRAAKVLRGLLATPKEAGPDAPTLWCGASARSTKECLCEDHFEKYSPPAPLLPFSIQQLEVTALPDHGGLGGTSAEILTKAGWTPTMLPIVGFGNWDSAFQRETRFRYILPDYVVMLNQTFAGAPVVVFRTPQFVPGVRSQDHKRMFNSGNSRHFRDLSLAAMREVFGARLLVWDVFEISAGRLPPQAFNYSCATAHAAAEIVYAEVQALLWQLSQKVK